jgi:molybdenum cofactor cytidylyltransferase
MLSCIVMASGYSKRLGRDKIFFKYFGKTLLEITIERLKKTSISEIIVVYRDHKAAEIANRYGVKAVYNHKAELGQSESIKAGILHADMNSDGYMFTVVDQPLMKSETVQRLIDIFEKNDKKIVLPKSYKKRGNPVVFPKTYRSELLSLSGDTGGKIILEREKENLLYLKVKDEELFDIDTEEDIEFLNRRMKNE